MYRRIVAPLLLLSTLCIMVPLAQGTQISNSRWQQQQDPRPHTPPALNDGPLNGLYFVEFRAPSPKERSLIAQYIPIDQIVEDSVYSLINADDFDIVKQKLSYLLVNYHFMTFETLNENHDNSENESTPNADLEFPGQDKAYHTYQEAVNELRALTQNYPQLATLTSIGKTHEQNDMWNLTITGISRQEQNAKDSFIPAIVFVGNHHGREHLSAEMPLLLAEYLLKNYATNAEIKRLLDTRIVHIIPMLNVDGAMFDIKSGRYQYWRKNRRINGDGSYGVDLNRNYGYQWGTGGSSSSPSSDVYMGTAPFSEPETRAFKSFIERQGNVRMMLTFHSFSEFILYPWGASNTPVAGRDGEVFVKMGEQMAQWNHYTPQASSDLYIASGDTCDWAYGEQKIFCFTFELTPRNTGWGGAGFYPGPNVIRPQFDLNLPAMLYMMEYTDSPYRVLN